MKKIYMASWGHDFHKQELRILKDKFFNIDNGYSEEDIETIHSLDVGETWVSADYPSHIVTCVHIKEEE